MGWEISRLRLPGPVVPNAPSFGFTLDWLGTVKQIAASKRNKYGPAMLRPSPLAQEVGADISPTVVAARLAQDKQPEVVVQGMTLG